MTKVILYVNNAERKSNGKRQPTIKSVRACSTNTCMGTPLYALQKPPLRCKKCKIAGDRNVYSPTCEDEICNTTPVYGPFDKKKVRCFTHRILGDILMGNVKCEKCTNPPIYGIDIVKRCETHKTQYDIDHRKILCNGCGLYGYLNDQLLCKMCSPVENVGIRKEKEKNVKDFLSKIPGIIFSTHDEKIYQYGNGCSRHRPDFLYDFDFHSTIIEVDEFQHIGLVECDKIRMVNIAQHLRRKTFFIRYNPDTFLVNGVEQTISNETRMDTLQKWLIFASEYTHIDNIISVVYLFYDNYSESETNVVSIETPI